MIKDIGGKMLYCRPTAIGMIGIAESGGTVTNLLFMEKEGRKFVETASTPLLDEAFDQLDAWLSGRIDTFSLPVAADGSRFAMRVWQALLDIPYGSTTSYGEIAAQIGIPGAARAVGSACGHNPLPIIIPCHRVINVDGRMGGYLGGLQIKRHLLDLERRNRG
ncbi:MAG TPA: methylated-DNA--[protein]-cysteine S-methyltransferase [Chlorobaculum sp.]|nr:methylated-DNA--[protein]-cysteine S-methyltransferase [Chlorobaculum sp.]